ncbi:MAG: hypothetical protein P8L37_08040 [Phycisphaerales bacterium]|nr:hypothetical protein [Phycisphaerales bacterium]
MGGKFEIIIVVIGLAWAIASSVMQKKAKAAKAARLKAIAQEDIAATAAPASSKPSETMFDRMMSQLREQIDVVAKPATPQRSNSGRTGAAKIGATVNVRPPVSNTPPAGQMDAEGVQSDRLEQMAAAQLLARQDGEQSEQGLITADGLRTILSDPSRIREAILLKEILDPPLALRN